MAYISHKINCPNCKNVISQGISHTQNSGHLFAGSPIELCPHCSMPYLTEKEYWGMLSSRKKIYFLIREYSLAILQPILFSVLPAVIAFAVFMNEQKNEGYFYISVAALVILAAIWILKRLSNIRAWMKWCPEPHLVLLYQECQNQKAKK